jgi:hypothetical protein
MIHPDDDDSKADWWEKWAGLSMDQDVDPELRISHAIEGVTMALIAISKRLKTIGDNQLN